MPILHSFFIVNVMNLVYYYHLSDMMLAFMVVFPGILWIINKKNVKCYVQALMIFSLQISSCYVIVNVIVNIFKQKYKYLYIFLEMQ